MKKSVIKILESNAHSQFDKKNSITISEKSKNESGTDRKSDLKDRIKTNFLDTLLDDEKQGTNSSGEGKDEEEEEDDDAFETVSDNNLSEDDDEVNDLNDFDGSFLKEMLIETNRHYIKTQESNEEKIQKMAARIVKNIFKFLDI